MAPRAPFCFVTRRQTAGKSPRRVNSSAKIKIHGHTIQSATVCALVRIVPAMTEKPLEQMGLRDLRDIARQRMPAEAWPPFNGAAETKETFYRTPRAFRQYMFR